MLMDTLLMGKSVTIDEAVKVGVAGEGIPLGESPVRWDSIYLGETTMFFLSKLCSNRSN